MGALDDVRAHLPVHPGLQPVTDVGLSDEGVYLASPVLTGSSVEGRLQAGRLSLDALLPWLRPVVEGLQAAHDAGLTHGAIHPKDIVATDDGGVLTGVGVARALESVSRRAPVRVPYTAPERASGGSWDARADQYSLAMLALDALSGRRLIAGTIPAFDRWTLAETPAEDARLHDVFAKALAPDPAERYASVSEFLEQLAGPERAAGALSRFAREGVILPVGDAPAGSPDAPIAVQPLEDPEGVALSLFPEEQEAIAPALVEDAAAEPPADEAAPTTGEHWLVADVPEDPEPPTEPIPMPVAPPVDEIPLARPSAPVGEGTWRLGDDSPELTPVPPAWEPPADEPSRMPWALVVAALVLAALGYAVWSATRPSAPAPVPQVASGVPETPAVSEAPVTPAPRRETPPAPRRAAPPRAEAKAATPKAAPAPPARTESAPAVVSAGRMLIRSSPAGQVRVNGRPHGETPVVLRDLAYGPYQVVIVRPGFEPVTRELVLTAEQPVAQVTVDLARVGSAPSSPVSAAPETAVAGPVTPAPAPTPPPVSQTSAPESLGAGASRTTGTIFVVSQPANGRLFVDGRFYGSTPAAIPGLTPGAHTVRVEIPGYRTWESQVQVVAGARVRVQATLPQGQE